jgi:hypothetical protein
MTAPDTTDARAHAEAVAYGKLLVTREILEALANARPRENPHQVATEVDYANTSDWYYAPSIEQIGWTSGYEAAFQVVKSTRLGVEK